MLIHVFHHGAQFDPAFARRVIGGNVVVEHDLCHFRLNPFSRNKLWATYTNDLNPDTAAEYHCEAREFLRGLIVKGIKADLVILDPPYSQVQVSRSYDEVGREYRPFGDDNNTVLYKETKNLLTELLVPNGIALTFGWNSVGFGKGRGFELLEILLVCHGGAHNDTICLAERRITDTQLALPMVTA